MTRLLARRTAGPPRQDRAVVVVPTCDRTSLLARALRSVVRQTRPPLAVVVIDDSPSEAVQLANRQLVHEAGAGGLEFIYLRNRRTTGLSGSLNSGIDELARRIQDWESVFVAPLDDDDAWSRTHLAQCLATARHADADLVWSGLFRHEAPGLRPRRQTIPTRLTIDDFLVGNPHVQGSNLFVRLSSLLKAGLFNEHLPSSTDRDLLIRLLLLNDLRQAATRRHTVHHFADTGRARLSTPGSEAKRSGLARFEQIYGPWMTAAMRAEAEARARRLFGEASPAPLASADTAPVQPAELGAACTAVAPSPHRPGLVVGAIVESAHTARAERLLRDLLELQSRHELCCLDVLLLENGHGRPSDRKALRRAVHAFVRDGLNVTLIPPHVQREDGTAGRFAEVRVLGDGALPIAPARSILQAYLYHAMRRRPGAYGWIIDDDMRLRVLRRRGGRRQRDFVNPFPLLAAARASGAQVALGAYTDAPPLPRSCTIRVQLTDLLHALAHLGDLEPDAPLPDLDAQNAQLERQYPDYYYDLARKTGHLEVPFRLVPERPGETVAAALARLLTRAPRILAGEQVTRPVIAAGTSGPAFPTDGPVMRGGNTFILDAEVLPKSPNFAPLVDGREVRRSDMNWVVAQERLFGTKVVSIGVPLCQDRSDLPAEGADVERIADDIMGYAAARALKETPPSSRPGAPEGTEAFIERAQKLLRERLAVFTLSWMRIRGIAESLPTLETYGRARGWWWATREEAESIRSALRDFGGRLRAVYTDAARQEIEARVRALSELALRTFWTGLSSACAAYEAAVRSWPGLPASLDHARVDAARATARRLLGAAHPLACVGMGREGVTLRHGNSAYKVFDGHFDAGGPQGSFLRAMTATEAARGPGGALRRLVVSGPHAVLERSYVPGRPYSGGCGPGLVRLLRDLRDAGMVPWNLSAANLVTSRGAVHLVDWGDSIRPWDTGAHAKACKKAWLLWRWPHRHDLSALLTRVARGEDFVELDGWERLRDAVDLKEGDSALQGLLLRLARAQSGTSVLDYGCGKGTLAVRLAEVGARVVGYDPDQSLLASRVRQGSTGQMVRWVTSRESARASGPFDMVVCCRVLCAVTDRRAFKTVLGDLRASVANGGRVLVAVCDPDFTGVRHLSYQVRARVTDDALSRTTVFTKTLASGRTRRDVHRPRTHLIRDLLRAGLRVVGEHRFWGMDLDRFERASEYLVLELEPVAEPVPDVAVVIRTCAMEAATIEWQVHHQLAQLEARVPFAERVLVVDRRSRGFLREYGEPDARAHAKACQRLLRDGWVDRVLPAPDQPAKVRRLNRAWFGLDSEATHTVEGAPNTPTLHAVETVAHNYLLHLDSDCILVRRDPSDDPVGRMVDRLRQDPRAVTVAMDVVHAPGTPDDPPAGTGFRVEVRACLLDRRRLLATRPWQQSAPGTQGPPAWYRALDVALASAGLHSLRGADPRFGFVHPPNHLKQVGEFWHEVVDAAERGWAPRIQAGLPDLVGSTRDWSGPYRTEPFVFVVCGRRTAPGRFLRCWDSILRQRGPAWGAVVVDDASGEPWSSFLRATLAPHRERVTLLHNRMRRGGLANTVRATREVCTDPDTVLVTLDADDALLGGDVLRRLETAYAEGADLTVGSMLRTDVDRAYPVVLEDPLAHRGGNVWQHLRTFRKSLFDRLPDDLLRVEGQYYELAADWAYMLPMVYLAAKPVALADPLYLYETSGDGKGVDRHRRERRIGQVCARLAGFLGRAVIGG